LKEVQQSGFSDGSFWPCDKDEQKSIHRNVKRWSSFNNHTSTLTSTIITHVLVNRQSLKFSHNLYPFSWS